MVLETAINNLERNSLKLDHQPPGSSTLWRSTWLVAKVRWTSEIPDEFSKKFRHKSTRHFFGVALFRNLYTYFFSQERSNWNWIYIGYIDFQVCGKSRRGAKVLDFSMPLERGNNFPRLDLGPIFSNRSQHPPFGFMESAGKATLSSGASQWLGGGPPSIEARCCFHCLRYISIFFIFHLLWYLDVPKLMAKLWKQDEPISVRPLICFLHVVPSNFHWVCYPNQRYIVGIFLVDGV